MAPNTLDVPAFRLELGNALAKCYHINREQSVGFDFLVNSKKIYFDWRGGKDSPAKPGKPIAPIGTMMYLELGLAAWILILKKFLKMLMDKLDKQFNALPATMTAQDAFKHIEDQVGIKMAKGELYFTLTRKIANQKCTLGPNGAKEYITGMIANQNCIGLLGAGNLGNLAVITYYLEAFSSMEELQTFWVKRLTGILSTKQHKAHFTEEVKDELDSGWADVAAYLIANQRNMVTVFQHELDGALTGPTPK
eukprot:jgi/Psemu1/28239/gm1.28239_g